MNKLIEQFNTEDTLLVISSYPPEGGEAAKQNAVACYTQNLLKAYKDRKIVVLSEIVDRRGYYVKDNILVIHCWRYRSPKLYFDLLGALLRFDKPKQVLVQFEFSMLGSFVHSALLPFILLLIKFFGKSVTVMMHQVVGDLARLGRHLNLNKDSLKKVILNKGLRLFYYFVGKFSDAIIVHEERLKETLSEWVDLGKISVVSHGLYLERQKKGRDEIRKSLGLKNNDFALLMFGYITWYKGTDWIINKVKEIVKKHPELRLKLIVAGGKSATLKNKSHYKTFLRKVENLVEKDNKQILMTGFVPDADVAKYYTAADLVVLPYRAMMSASGPLSFALRFNKPYLVSEALSYAFKNPDVRFVLSRLNLDSRDFVFSLQKNDFEEKITQIVKDRKILKRIGGVTSDLRVVRQWRNIVGEYNLVLTKASKRAVPARIRGVVIPKLMRPLRLFVQ
ncbi:MAG: glycosyltransferase [Patescibacteria group bacterium]